MSKKKKQSRGYYSLLNLKAALYCSPLLDQYAASTLTRVHNFFFFFFIIKQPGIISCVQLRRKITNKALEL